MQTLADIRTGLDLFYDPNKTLLPNAKLEMLSDIRTGFDLVGAEAICPY